MGEVINLNKFRKAKERAEKNATAAQNRVKHGRTTGEKVQAKSQRDKQMRDLSNKHIEQSDDDMLDDDDDKQPA